MPLTRLCGVRQLIDLDARFVDRDYTALDARQMYYNWPLLDGLTDAYLYSNDDKYLATAVELCEAYMAAGIYHDSDGFLDWYSSLADKYSHNHAELEAAKGLAKTVHTVLTHSNNPSLVDRATTLLPQIEMHVWDKWDQLGFFSTEITHWIGRIGSVAIYLHELTGDAKYSDYVDDRGRYLKSVLRVHDDAYVWDTGPGKWASVVDTSHGADTVFSFFKRMSMAWCLTAQT